MVSSLKRWKRISVSTVEANPNGSLNTASSSSSIISIICPETHCRFHLLFQVSTKVLVMLMVTAQWKMSDLNKLSTTMVYLLKGSHWAKGKSNHLYIGTYQEGIFPLFLRVNFSTFLFQHSSSEDSRGKGTQQQQQH